jgi:nitroreductase/ferredoxin
MEEEIRIGIDRSKCIGCGLCISVCPADIFTLQDERPVVVTSGCIGCEHCVAVCPESALTLDGVTNDLNFSTFAEKKEWLRWGDFAVSDLVQLLRSRRSCRNYKKDEVQRQYLEDLVKIGITAPSGSNSQRWTFTVLPVRGAVEALGHQIADYFKNLNRLASNPVARIYARIFHGDRLGNYFRNYYSSVDKALQAWEKEGRDILFHGAPAVIVIGSSIGASCPQEDALMAAQNILLAAHAMGLGTCMIGYAVAAMNNDIGLKRYVDIPESESIHAIIAVGYPNEEYQRLAGRKPFVQRWPNMFGKE